MDEIEAIKLPPVGFDADFATKRYLVIANPYSGRRHSTATIEMIKSRLNFHRSKADVRLTEHANHARQIAKETCLDGY